MALQVKQGLDAMAQTKQQGLNSLYVQKQQGIDALQQTRQQGLNALAVAQQQAQSAMALQQQQQYWQTNVQAPLEHQYNMERIAAEIQGQIALADYEAQLNKPSMFEQIISGIPIIGDAGRIFGWW